MKHDTAGDPMTGVKWTRRTTDKIACELRSLGVNVSSKTVGRLLKQLGLLAAAVNCTFVADENCTLGTL